MAKQVPGEEEEDDDDDDKVRTPPPVQVFLSPSLLSVLPGELLPKSLRD